MAEKRLIDKEALLSDIELTITESGCVNHEREIIDCVKYAPTIDAVAVVRCRECKIKDTEECPMSECEEYKPYNYRWVTDPKAEYCSYGKPECGSKMDAEKESEGK